MKKLSRSRSAGYNAIAEEFIRCRNPTIGVAVLRAWARNLPPGAAVLDLGCGHGIPISQVLIEEGFELYGVDASPVLVKEFRQRFPDTPVACEAVEESAFFGRTFDGVVAWGLVFLLEPETQLSLMGRVASVLNAGGRFLFTAPEQVCTWTDVLTGRPSNSLGAEAYRSALADVGLSLVAEPEDEGGNHYYEARKV
jgi:2-polyprenyl-3-methyl-5-hydroxy-6-metoxy-1,4-benzoquinol methylase